MADHSEGDKDGGARREVNHQSQIPKNDLTTLTEVEHSEGHD